MMKQKVTKLLTIGTLLCTAVPTQAQKTEDVTFSLTPVVGYTIWSDNLNLGNSPFWGIQGGFGIGSNFELRGGYERTFDLKSKLNGSSWNVLSNLAGKMENTTVDISRWGGEMKVNLWRGPAITPYLTAGGGVMKFKYNAPDTTSTYSEKQLYASLGAGLKVNLGRNFVWAIEGKNMLFNVNSQNAYLVPGANADKVLQNWNLQTSFTYYFGNGNYASTDKVFTAYRNMFTDGFRGMKFVVEPSVAYINFNDESMFRDQWMAGVSAGVDFSSLIGVRGFYYSATKNPDKLEPSLTSNLQMYGGNLFVRLNQPRGVTPYLNLGAGYLNVNEDKYLDSYNTYNAKSGWFALGGVGMEVPLGKNMALFASANAMINEQDNPDATQVYEPSQVKVNMMYTGGVRFNLGASSKNGTALYKSYAEDLRLAEQKANMERFNQMKAEYDKRIEELNSELMEAATYKDTLAMTRVLLERERTQKLRADIEARTDAVVRSVQEVATNKPANQVAITTSQFDTLVQRVVNELRKERRAAIVPKSSSLVEQLILLNALQQGQMSTQQVISTVKPVTTTQNTSDTSSLVLQKLNEITNRLEKNEKNVGLVREELSKIQSPNLYAPVRSENVVTHVLTPSDQVIQSATTYDITKPNRLAIFTGPSFGDAVNWNVGVRAYKQLGTSNFDFMPEAFLGLGKDTGFGLSANIVYNTKLVIASKFQPYVGLGLGYTHVGKVNRIGMNTLIGANINSILGGKFFVDYSIRNAFRNNQFVAGYRFDF